MPRYFFWNEDGECHPDYDGVELVNMDEARRYGLKTLCEIVMSKTDVFYESGDWKLTVKSDDGLTLFMLVIAVVEGAGGT